MEKSYIFGGNLSKGILRPMRNNTEGSVMKMEQVNRYVRPEGSALETNQPLQIQNTPTADQKNRQGLPSSHGLKS